MNNSYLKAKFFQFSARGESLLDLKKTFLEAVSATIPMTIIILIFHLTIAPFPQEILISFIAGAILVMLGLFLFFIGINVGLLKVGELIGSSLIKREKLWFILSLGFIIGFVIVIAEPNMQVLASQVDGVSNGKIAKNLLIAVVALGVGVSIIVSLLRIIFRISLTRILAVCYGIIFILALFVPPELVPVSFDAGGVTTGPLIVPFMLSLGIGFTSVMQSQKTNDSFGLISLVFISSILAVLILGVFIQ